MRWYPRLYTGPMAASARYRIIQGLRAGKFMPSVYGLWIPTESWISTAAPITGAAECRKRIR